RMASDIYRHIAVNIAWIDKTSCQLQATSEGSVERADLVVLLASRAAVTQMGVPEDVLGFAPRTEPHTPGRAIYVVYDRVGQMARTLDVDAATLCAHVVSHEIGHALLPYGAHSLAGIMRAQWDLQQLHAAERRALWFSPDEARVIRGALMARIGSGSVQPS